MAINLLLLFGVRTLGGETNCREKTEVKPEHPQKLQIK